MNETKYRVPQKCRDDSRIYRHKNVVMQARRTKPRVWQVRVIGRINNKNIWQCREDIETQNAVLTMERFIQRNSINKNNTDK